MKWKTTNSKVIKEIIKTTIGVPAPYDKNNRSVDYIFAEGAEITEESANNRASGKKAEQGDFVVSICMNLVSTTGWKKFKTINVVLSKEKFSSFKNNPTIKSME